MSLSNQGDNISHALERARETGKLDLSNLGLPGIPPEIFELTNLVELDLSHNSIVTVPPAIRQLTALKSLRLEDNRLTQLPRYNCYLLIYLYLLLFIYLYYLLLC
jgi:Leucine-rich repeat (LRR) protein